MAGELARGGHGSLASLLAVHPELFTGGGIECDDGSAGTGGGVDNAVDHERGRFELKLGARAERVGFESPGDFEFVEVGRVDLIERGVAGGGEVASVTAPFSIGSSGLGECGGEGASSDRGCGNPAYKHEYDVTRSGGFWKMGRPRMDAD